MQTGFMRKQPVNRMTQRRMSASPSGRDPALLDAPRSGKLWTTPTVMLLAVIVTRLCGPSPAAAGWSAAFPSLDAGARGMALGGNLVAIAEGSEALSWNPAGMLSLEQREVSFTYSDLFGLDLVQHTVVHFAWPFRRHTIRWEEGEIRREALPPPASKALGLSISSLRCGLDEGSYREMQFGLGLAWAVRAGIHAGAAARFQTTQTGHEGPDGSGMAVDVGIQRRWRGLRAGIAGLNLVSTMDWEEPSNAPAGRDSDDPLPPRWSSGLAWSPRGDLATLAVSGDWMHGSFRRVQYATGLEIRPLDPLILRAGWRSRRDAVGERREWSAGMGVIVSGLAIDYAWRESGHDLGDTHRWSASLGL